MTEGDNHPAWLQQRTQIKGPADAGQKANAASNGDPL
jgi:hypothetical protein